MTYASATLNEKPRRAATKVGGLGGLDLGTHSAKLVVCRRRGATCSIVRAHTLRLPPRSWTDPVGLAAVLRPWLRSNFVCDCRDLVLSLPSCLVDYETIELPGSGAQSLDTHVESAMRELLGAEFALAAYDYWLGPSPHAGAPATLHLAWTSCKFAAQLAMQLARDGWRCAAIDVPALALSRVSAPGERASEQQLVVDISANQVSIVCTRGGIVKYVRNGVRIAHEPAAEIVARELGVRSEVAEQVLSSYGVGDAAEQFATRLQWIVRKQLDDWLARLVAEVERTMNYLQHSYGLDVIDQVVLCGGGASIRGISLWLGERLRVPVRMAGLPGQWSWEAAEPYSPAYAVAVSLTGKDETP